MLKKKIFIVAAFMVLIISTGCGTSVKSDLDAYLKFEQTMSAEANPVIAEFNTKASQIMSNRLKMDNKEEKLAALNDVLQKYTTLIEKEKAYQPKTKEVQEIHAKAVKQADMTIEELHKVIQAVESDKADQATIDEINQKRQELNKIAQEYKADIMALQEKNK